jgi:hypothetical protein
VLKFVTCLIGFLKNKISISLTSLIVLKFVTCLIGFLKNNALLCRKNWIQRKCSCLWIAGYYYSLLLLLFEYLAYSLSGIKLPFEANNVSVLRCMKNGRCHTYLVSMGVCIVLSILCINVMFLLSSLSVVFKFICEFIGSQFSKLFSFFQEMKVVPCPHFH